MKLMLSSIALICCSTAANASPVFLNCVLTTPRAGPLKIDIQLNEEGGTVGYTFPDNGRSYTVRGIFTPDHVSFMRFSVSRTDLTIQRRNDGQFDQSVYHLAPVDTGRCVMDSRKRAF